MPTAIDAESRPREAAATTPLTLGTLHSCLPL